MPEIIFQFSTSHEFASRLIRDYLGSPFSHVEAVTPDGGLYGSSDAKDHPCMRGNPNGVAVRPQDYQLFLRRRRARVEVTAQQYATFWRLADQELGKDFDGDAVSLKWVFGGDDPFARDWRYDQHWWCAELHAYLLEKIRLWDYPLIVPKNVVTPHMLLTWMWPKMTNRATFWLFPAELEPQPGEELELPNLSAAKVKEMFGG